MKNRLAGLGLLAIVFGVSLLFFKGPKTDVTVLSRKSVSLTNAFQNFSLFSTPRKSNINFIATEQGDSTALKLTQQFILENLDRFPIQQYHHLKGETLKSPLGTLVSYKVYQDGVPIVGLQLDFRVNSRNQVLELFNGYQPVAEMKLEPDRWLTIERVVALQSLRYKKVEHTLKNMEKPNIIWVEPGSNRVHWGYVLEVVDVLQKRKVPEQAIFSDTTGQLLVRELSRSEFNRLPGS
jgi:hypothetical protein